MPERTYELGVIVNARESDDDVQAIATRFREMLEADGVTVEEDHWGKRKLAYPIHKQIEGKYFFLYVTAPGAVTWTDIERLLMQDERVLRHLVVRTDQDLKRAASKGKQKPTRTTREAPAEAS